jgi:hypothetical protein
VAMKVENRGHYTRFNMDIMDSNAERRLMFDGRLSLSSIPNTNTA